jgi:hypothetical protein
MALGKIFSPSINIIKLFTPVSDNMLILLAVMIKFFDLFAWKSKNVPTRYLILNVGALLKV